MDTFGLVHASPGAKVLSGENREVLMLDAYIIDRIRRDRENAQRRRAQLPLHIEDPPDAPVPPGRRQNEKEDPERGSVVIDFKL